MAQSNNTTKEEASFYIRRQRRVSSIAVVEASWVIYLGALLERKAFSRCSQMLAYAFELPMRRSDIKRALYARQF